MLIAAHTMAEYMSRHCIELPVLLLCPLCSIAGDGAAGRAYSRITWGMQDAVIAIDRAASLMLADLHLV